ncbi:MAG TPA: helix-turn-helix domain-containing protein [Pyrinomonadaceae bacterium]|jgi:tetratricopeptide (TPR) repeat protein|nr:helix-turn-helix domain-containing protein [Pyrinomonadaceae bacterium]
MELYEREDHEGAQATLRRFWRRVGERPDTSGLHASVAAELLLCVGILTGWIGSKIQIDDAQETAKNLISEVINYFTLINDRKKVAAAQVELAYCYWRNGESDEARILLSEALQQLTTEGETKAKAILKLTTIEWTAGRYCEALTILGNNASLFQKVPNHNTQGAYHSQIAIILRNLATPQNRDEYFQRAINEYKEAARQFKLARNPIYRADVKNNLGPLFYKLSRFTDAHKYLDEARRLTLRFKDKARTAQINETRAQVYLAQGKLKDAAALARTAATALAKSGHQSLVADALTTQGIALARSHQVDRAHLIFQNAIEVALQVDAYSNAGLAALSLIEEISDLSPATLQAAYEKAREWLADSQSQDTLSRLNAAAGKFVQSVRSDLSADDATEILLTKGFDLQQKLLDTEREMITKALAQTNGRITPAARLLGLSYQGLAYIIDSRHKDLLKVRSPKRSRKRKSR